MLISLEGIDGAGKTTLINRVKDSTNDTILNNFKLKTPEDYIIFTKAPYDPNFTEIIKNNDLDNMSLLHLFLADRRKHWLDIIKPALEQGKIVLTDRFIDSTVIYQGLNFYENNYNNEYSSLKYFFEKIARLTLETTDYVVPDKTFWLNTSLPLIKGRLIKRGSLDNIEKSINIDKLHLTFEIYYKDYFYSIFPKRKNTLNILNDQLPKNNVDKVVKLINEIINEKNR
jgi:dTMP kinase